ncbi:MAG: hypothetical protein IPL07_02445 [Acidimicrobiaceae bacterium]|nr:hypothetical protein [Acidimicrobiaceae bacterium]
MPVNVCVIGAGGVPVVLVLVLAVVLAVVLVVVPTVVGVAVGGGAMEVAGVGGGLLGDPAAGLLDAGDASPVDDLVAVIEGVGPVPSPLESPVLDGVLPAVSFGLLSWLCRRQCDPAAAGCRQAP